MKFSLVDFFEKNKEAIIAEWARRIRTQIGDLYASRPEEEVVATVTEAYDAFMAVIIDHDYRHIDAFIKKIVRMRLAAGSLLSDVQLAFEFFRTISIPLLAKKTTIEAYRDAIITINHSMTHTIHQFSDLFQSMQQSKIIEHNQRLEEQVRLRTAELKDSEQRYKILVEEINDGFYVIHDEVFVFVNSATGLMHGYKPSEMIGQKFYNFVDPLHRERVMKGYYKGLDTELPQSMIEYLRLTKEGESYPTESFSKVTEWENRLSVIGICRDITARVQMEEKIRESERLADIGRIVTSLSHEIRNPLSAVQMNLQILKKNPQLKGNDQKRVDISVREVKRLEKILQELLDFSKPIRLNLKKSHLNKILLSAIELLEMKILSENLTLDADLDPDLPRMQIDSEMLSQAVLNLLLNAVEASSAGKRIELRSRYDRENGGMAVIMVSDEGPGIPENHFFEIYKPFFTTKVKGTGIGLNNVKRIAEAHKGRVEVNNLLPHGACFTLYIPVR